MALKKETRIKQGCEMITEIRTPRNNIIRIGDPVKRIESKETGYEFFVRGFFIATDGDLCMYKTNRLGKYWGNSNSVRKYKRVAECDESRNLLDNVLAKALKAETDRDKCIEALKEIAKGEGRYDMDKLKHAENTIEDMKQIANDIINQPLRQ
jgi:hypothetical protein